MFYNSTEEIREFLPVSTGIEFSRLKPHLQIVEQIYIRPLLGKELCSELDQLQSGQSPSGELSQLLSLIRISEIHLAYWLGYDVLNSYISDGGFRRIETEKIKGLYKYQEDNLKEYFKTIGFNSLDNCLEFIDENIETLASFKQSETWKALNTSFIPDTRTFNSIYFINNSRLIFLRLLGFFTIIEDMHLKLILGDHLIYIKTELIKDEPDGKVIDIIPYIRKPLAFLSVSMLMEESGADLSDKGLYFEGKTSTFSNDATRQPADKQRITEVIKRTKALGESYLVQLKEYLIANATSWNDYSAPKSGLHNRDNTSKKTFWT